MERGGRPGAARVSIRSRRLGREEHAALTSMRAFTKCFNPLPAVGPGGTAITTAPANERVSFQSAPGGWAGRNKNPAHASMRPTWFQSAPGGWAGRNGLVLAKRVVCQLFQSAPGGWAGRNVGTSQKVLTRLSFNPLPAVGPGGTVGTTKVGITKVVSIRSRRLGREERSP